MNVTETTSSVPLRTDAKGVIRIGQTRVRLDTVVIAWRRVSVRCPAGLVLEKAQLR